MSASIMISAGSVLALGIEVSPSHTCTFPTWRRNEPGVRLVSRPRFLRREAVVSLDTSRAPAMLHRVGMRLFAGESQ
jgi:hypothetical protein